VGALVRYCSPRRRAEHSFAIPAQSQNHRENLVEATDSSSEIAEQTLKLFFEPERNVLPKQAEITSKVWPQVIAFLGERTHHKTLPSLNASSIFNT